MIVYYFDLELVTIITLTRGTGNHSRPTVSSSGGSRGSGGSTTVVIPVMLNGSEIWRAIKQMSLEDFSLQVW